MNLHLDFVSVRLILIFIVKNDYPKLDKICFLVKYIFSAGPREIENNVSRGIASPSRVAKKSSYKLMSQSALSKSYKRLKNISEKVDLNRIFI